MCLCGPKCHAHSRGSNSSPHSERDERVNLVFGLMLLSNNWQERRSRGEGGGSGELSEKEGVSHVVAAILVGNTSSRLFCKKRSFIRYINDIHTYITIRYSPALPVIISLIELCLHLFTLHV